MKKSELIKIIKEELVQEKRFPSKAVDYNKVDNPDGFWNWKIKDANRLAGISFGRQTEVGDIIMYLNTAATFWGEKVKRDK